jgi:hypothetical protein
MSKDPVLEQLKSLGFDTSKTISLGSSSPISQKLIDNADIYAFNSKVVEQQKQIQQLEEQQKPLADAFSTGIRDIISLSNTISGRPDLVDPAKDPAFYNTPGIFNEWLAFWGKSDAIVNKSIAQGKLASQGFTDEDVQTASILKQQLEKGDMSALSELKDKFQNVIDSPVGEYKKNEAIKNYQAVAQYVRNVNSIQIARENLAKWFNNTDAATRERQLKSGIKPIDIGLPEEVGQNIYKLAELENGMYGSVLYNNNDLEVFKNKSEADMRSSSTYGTLLANMELQYNTAMTEVTRSQVEMFDEQIAEQNKKIKENTDKTLAPQYAKELNQLTAQRQEYKKLLDAVSPTSLEKNYLKTFYPNLYEKRQVEKKQELYRNSGEQGWWGRAGETAWRTGQSTLSNLTRQGSGLLSLVGADTWAFEVGVAADNLRPPSYYVGKDLNKNSEIDDDEILRDIHNNRVTWDQVHYTTKNGEGNWNLWSATEQVLPIAADIALTIALSKGIGAGARLGGLSWANIGTKLGLEGAALTRFTTQVSPHIATFGSVTATTFPRFYAEERRNFKNDGDAFGIALSRAVVEGLSESITPDVLMFQKAGTRHAGLLDNLFGRMESKLPFDLNRFSTKIDLLLGLTPRGGMSPLTAALLLAPRAVRNTVGGATQESLEEIGSLFGNYLVDKLAQGQNFEVPQENELSIDSIQETFVSGFIPSLLISGISGNRGIKENRISTARWDIANNPETYKAIIARQVESGKISKEEGIKKLAQVQATANKLNQMLPELNNIRDINTLLDDKEAQFQHFNNTLFLEEMLNVDVSQLTEEQKAEYDKELEDAKKAVIETRKMSDKYANLSEAEKRDIIEKNFKSKIDALESPETTLGAILNLAASMDPNQGEKVKNDPRYEFLNQQYQTYFGALTNTLVDRVSTFEDILLNSPEQLTLLELQVMQEKFVPVLEQLEKAGSPFVGAMPNLAPLDQTVQIPFATSQTNSTRIGQLIDLELSTRTTLTEEESINQIAANLNNPELRDSQRLDLEVAALTEEEIESGELSKETQERLKDNPVVQFNLAYLLEVHKGKKEIDPNALTQLDDKRRVILNNNYKLATEGLTPDEAKKKIIEINKAAIEAAKQMPPRQNFGGRRGINPVTQLQAEGEEAALAEYDKDVFDLFSGIVNQIIDIENSDLDIEEKKQQKARLLNTAFVSLGELNNKLAFVSGLIALFPQLSNKVDTLLSDEIATKDFFLDLFPNSARLADKIFQAYSNVVKNELAQNPPVSNQTNVQEGVTDTDTVNGIGSITFTNPNIQLFPIVLDGNVWNVVNTNKRPKVLININGVLVPFYLTTGLGGKGLKPGWYPFFGIGKDGWMNKTDKADMETYYARYWGSEVASIIQDISEQLNSVYGTNAESFVDDGDPTATSKPLTTLTDKVEDYINSVISITPFNNDKTARGMRGNVEQLGREITEALNPKQNTEDITVSNKTKEDTKFDDKALEQQLIEEYNKVEFAPDTMALKLVSSKAENISTLDDPAMRFAYNIVQEISNQFRKGNNPGLSVRTQSMMGIYEFILSEDNFETLKTFQKKKKLTEQEEADLRSILSMDGRSLHNEDFIKYIVKNPKEIGSGIGTVLVKQDGTIARFNSKGKELKSKGSYFISVLPKNQSSKRATENIVELRKKLDGTSVVAVSPVTGTLSGADVTSNLSERANNPLYLHTSEKSETQKTEFSEYTLLTGGLYIVNNNPVIPYSKVILPKASATELFAMMEAFNNGTLPPGLDPDYYSNPNAFLQYLEQAIYFSEKKTGFRLGVNNQGKIVISKKNKTGKYQQLTGKAETQFQLVNEALSNTFYSVNKDLLESNKPYKFLKLEGNQLKVYNFNTYEEFVRSGEFGAKFVAKENETISFGGEITYTNLKDGAVATVTEEVTESPVEDLENQEDLAIAREEYKELKKAFDEGTFGLPVDRAIASFGAFKVNLETIFDDNSTISLSEDVLSQLANDPTVRRTYVNSVSGKYLEDLAQEITSKTGVEVTPVDIVNFMTSFRKGIGTSKSTDIDTFYGAYNPDNNERYQEAKEESKESFKAFARRSPKISNEDPINPDELFRSVELDNTVSEEQNKKAEAWINNHPIFKNTTLIFDRTFAHPLAYAAWSKSAIFLYEGSNYADAYHEAWHEFSQMYLGAEERENLYKEARKFYGELSDFEIEEKLAEDFRLFALSDGKVMPQSLKTKESKNIFAKMWDFIKSFFTEKKVIDSYFTDLYRGNLSSYSYQADPRFKTLFSSKFQGVTPEGEPFILSHKESAKLTDQLDSLFVQTIKDVYESQGISIVNIIANKKAIQAVYGHMAASIDGLIESYTKLPESKFTKTRQRKFEFLDMLATNYSEVVQHHIKNSLLFESNKIKKSLLNEEVENTLESYQEFAQFEASINEKSGKTNAAPLIIAAIKTLPEYSEKRRKRKDTVFGTDYLGNFDKNWDILQKTLANSSNYEELYSKVKELSAKYLQFKPLLDYLPNPKEAVSRQSTLNFKNLFFNTFAQPYVEGYTAKINYTTNADEQLVIESLSMLEASNLDSINLRRLFDQRFSSTIGPYKLINPETGAYYLNTQKYFEDFPTIENPKAYMEQDEKSEYNLYLYNALVPLGFDLSEAGLELLKKADNNDLLRAVRRIRAKVQSLSEAIPYIASPLSDISRTHTSPSKEVIEKESNSVLQVINYETEANVEFVGDMRYNALGDKIWSVNPHNFMSRVVAGLNNSSVYPTLESLYKDFPQLNKDVNPSVANSSLLKYLFDVNGKRRLEKDGSTRTIKLANLLGIEDKNPTKTVDADGAKKHFADVNGLLQKGIEEINRLSGKSTTRGLVLPYSYLKNTFEIDKPFINMEKSEVPSSFIINNIIPLIAAEILVTRNPSTRFKVNPIENEVPRLTYFEGILSSSLRSELYEMSENLTLDKISDAISSNKDLTDAIISSFRSYVANNVAKSQELLKGYPTTVDQLTKYHAYSFVSRVEQHKLFFGHPYYYKSHKEIEKRISAWNAFGSYGVLDKQNIDSILPKGYNQRNAYLAYNESLDNPREVMQNIQDPTKINYLVLKDNPVVSMTAYLSENYGNLKDEYIDNGKAQDAAAFSTMDFYKRFYSLSTGISEDMAKEFDRQDRIYSLYLQEKAGEDVTEELNKALNEGPYYKFTIKKLQYAGQNLTNDGVIPVFHKYSVKPILPSEIIGNEELGTVLEKLHLSGADYGVFESGTKISETVNPTPLYNEDNSINSNGVLPGKIDMSGLKEQVLIENKETYKTIFSTQFRKLLYKDMTPAAQELYNAYVGYIDEITNYDKSEFLSKIEDKEKLVNFLLAESSKKNASEATKDLIKLKENGQLQYTLDAFLDRTIMESSMASVIKSSIIRQKVPGVQRVQYPVSVVKPGRKLRYYDIENGKIRQAETMISFSEPYYPLLKLIYNGKQIGEFVDGKPVNKFKALQTLNEALQDSKFLKDNAKFLDQALTTVAIRVPGQGYNSMESFRVIEFLPEESGEIILVPDEMVIKSGSDYDIDKLFCYDPYISDDLKVPTTKKGGAALLKQKEKASQALLDSLAIRKELAQDKKRLINQVKAVIDKYGYNSENVELKDLYQRLINLEDSFEDNDKNEAEGLQEALQRLANRDWSTSESKQKADPVKQEVNKLRRLLKEAKSQNLTESIGNVVEALSRIELDIQKYRKQIKESRAMLTNNLFLNIKERLSNAEIFESLITPNSSSLIKAEAKNQVEQYGRDPFQTSSYTNIVNPHYQLYVHTLNSFKKSLGVDAKNNTFHTLAQHTGLKIINPFANYAYPLRRNGAEEDTIDLSKQFDVEGNRISELSGQMLTAHVDIERDDDVALINFNNIITPTANYLNMAGSTFQDIVKLINTRYFHKGKVELSSVVELSKSNNKYNLVMDAMERVKELELDSKKDKFLYYLQTNDSIKYKKLLAKATESPVYQDKSYLGRTDAYGDLLRLVGFLQAQSQQDEVFKVSSNVDFDTVSVQNLESFFEWQNTLSKFYQADKPYFNLEALTKIAFETEVSGFAITKDFIGKLKALFPVTLSPQVQGGLATIKNDEALTENYDTVAKAFKNEYIYTTYLSAVPEVREYVKLLDKKNLGNIFNLYSNLKLRLKQKGIESENEIFDNATFNTENTSAWYRTGLRIPEMDYSVDVFSDEFESGLSWNNSKLNPENLEDAQLIDDMQAFFRAFAYVGIIGSNLNKRFDSYLPLIPKEVFTLKISDALMRPSLLPDVSLFEKRFKEMHPEFFGKRSEANVDLKYFRDYDLNRESIVNPLKPVELTLAEKPKQPVESKTTVFNSEDKELKIGSVVDYNGARYILWKYNSKGDARLLKPDGSKFPGNPRLYKLSVVGSYPIVNYNNVDYIVRDKESIYSTATGDNVYQGTDNSSIVQKERILQAVGLIEKPVAMPQVNEVTEDQRDDIVRNSFKEIVELNKKLRENC